VLCKRRYAIRDENVARYLKFQRKPRKMNFPPVVIICLDILMALRYRNLMSKGRKGSKNLSMHDEVVVKASSRTTVLSLDCLPMSFGWRPNRTTESLTDALKALCIHGFHCSDIWFGGSPYGFLRGVSQKYR
jgi:hypothetical protein